MIGPGFANAVGGEQIKLLVGLFLTGIGIGWLLFVALPDVWPFFKAWLHTVTA